MNRRIAAVVALVSGAAAALLLILTVWREFPRGLEVVALVVVAAVAGWQGVRRRGTRRTVLLVAGAVALVAALVMVVLGGVLVEGLVAVVLVVLASGSARYAYRVHVRWPAAPPPTRAVVVYNAKSGGGKAASSHLAEQARARGITPRELVPGEDWAQVVRDLVADGADGLMAAGGDGTQALVATIAAEHDLPFACIPAGTRNHFARDLGVDRNDVVGALDAFVDGGERLVDLSEVNGRVFVNNASLGLYAEAVQREGYRDAKLRTILDTAPDVMGTDASQQARTLRFTGPDGAERTGATVVLVSNGAYRLGRVIGSGARPRIDDGVLGVAALRGTGGSARARLWEQWTTTSFVVDSDGPVPIGIDGEALVMEPPLRFTTRPRALRVRLSPRHPGISPAATLPNGLRDSVLTLLQIARGVDPAHLAHRGDPVPTTAARPQR